MEFEIKTAKEQWNDVFEKFMASGESVERLECDSYANKQTLIVAARRYAEELGYPVYIHTCWDRVLVRRKK